MTSNDLPQGPEVRADGRPPVGSLWAAWPAVDAQRRALAALLLLAMVGFAAYSVRHAFAPGYVLGWDSIGHAIKVAYLRDHLLPRGRWDGWFAHWHAGLQLFQFYPPGFYVVTALLSLIPGTSLPVVFNVMAVGSYILLPVSVFLALRWMGMGRSGALMSAGLSTMVGSWYGGGISGIFATGLIPNTWGIALLPLVLAAWQTGLARPGRRAALIMAALTAALVLTHTFSTYVAAVGASVFLVYQLVRRQWRLIPYAAAITAGIVALGAAWLVPTLLKYSWHGLIGAWAVPTVGEAARAILTGEMVTCHVAAWVGLVGIVIGLVRGGWRRELATYALVMMAMVMGVINRVMPFGDIVGSSQFVRFQGYFALCLAMTSGLTVEYAWTRLRHMAGPKRLVAWVVPAVVTVLVIWVDGHNHLNLSNGMVKVSSDVAQMEDVKAIMSAAKAETQPTDRLLAEFDWNAQHTHGSPHILDQGLVLWAERSDLGGNFSEGSRVSDLLSGINTLPVDNPNLLPQLRRYGVSHLVTFSANHDDTMATKAGLRRLAHAGTVSLWVLEPPGRLVSAEKPVVIGPIRQDQDAFDVELDNPTPGNGVVLAYNAYPNWSVTWNHQPLVWTETAERFMRVSLPAGQGTLSWRFRWYPMERACDVVAWTAWAFWLVLAYRWSRHGAYPAPAV